MISEEQLTWMREMLAASLNRTCTISTPSAGASDEYGEQGAGAPTLIEDVRCSFEPLRAFERGSETGALAGADHMLYLPYDVGGEYLVVPANATVTVQADDTNPERVFRVTGQLESSQAVGHRVAATLVQ